MISARVYPATNHCLKPARDLDSFKAEVKSKSTSDPSLPIAVSYMAQFLEIWDDHFVLESLVAVLLEFGFKILGFDPAQKNKVWAPVKHLKSAVARGWLLYLHFRSDAPSARGGREYKPCLWEDAFVPDPSRIPRVSVGIAKLATLFFSFVQFRFLSIVQLCVWVCVCWCT